MMLPMNSSVKEKEKLIRSAQPPWTRPILLRIPGVPDRASEYYSSFKTIGTSERDRSNCLEAHERQPVSTEDITLKRLDDFP